MLEDRGRCEAMGSRGREIALEMLSAEKYIDCFIELYDKMRRAKTRRAGKQIPSP
jgi:glycosyltransferase involved in cell wall biosynthesis